MSMEEENVPSKDSTPPQSEISAEKEEKPQVNVEVLENGETVTSPIYQIRPQLHEKFNTSNAREIIQNVLFDQLSAKIYDAEEAAQWSKDIADMIRKKIKELSFKRYKYVISVVLGEQHGAGVKISTRSIWDAEADTYAYDSFVNDTLFCVATVYAVYFY